MLDTVRNDGLVRPGVLGQEGTQTLAMTHSILVSRFLITHDSSQ